MLATFARGTLAATAAGMLAVSIAAPADASDVSHDTVVSETAMRGTPHIASVGGDHPVAYSISQTGNTMIVGGKFNAVEDPARTVTLTRGNVMAFSAVDGAVRPFAPSLDGQVWSVLGDGDTVYLGGEFRTVNGTTRPALAKVNLTTGTLDPSFAPPFTGGRVTDMALSHGQLIVAGTFRKKLMSLSPTTGKPTSYLTVGVAVPLPFTNRPEVFHFSISPDGRHLVAVGNFTQVDAQRNWRVFMMDLGGSSATLSPWVYTPSETPCHAQQIPFYQMYVRDVDFAPDSSYFVVASTGGFITREEDRFTNLCDSAARFETDNLTPTAPTWINKTGGDTLHSVVVTGAAVYVQGHSRWLDNPYGQDSAGPGAVSRPGGGAIDPQSGMALAWNPVMPQEKGGYQMLATPDGVWFATDGKRFHGDYHRGIRFAPLP